MQRGHPVAVGAGGVEGVAQPVGILRVRLPDAHDPRRRHGHLGARAGGGRIGETDAVPHLEVERGRRALRDGRLQGLLAGRGPRPLHELGMGLQVGIAAQHDERVPGRPHDRVGGRAEREGDLAAGPKGGLQQRADGVVEAGHRTGGRRGLDLDATIGGGDGLERSPDAAEGDRLAVQDARRDERHAAGQQQPDGQHERQVGSGAAHDRPGEAGDESHERATRHRPTLPSAAGPARRRRRAQGLGGGDGLGEGDGLGDGDGDGDGLGVGGTSKA